jgi:hypothetical protein
MQQLTTQKTTWHTHQNHSNRPPLPAAAIPGSPRRTHVLHSGIPGAPPHPSD